MGVVEHRCMFVRLFGNPNVARGDRLAFLRGNERLFIFARADK